MGMRGLNSPSVDAFYRRGMLKDVRESSLAWLAPTNPGFALKPQTNGSAPAPRFAGHFAGIMLDANKVDFSNQPWIIPGPSIGGGMVSLEAIEHLLADRANELGVDIRRGHEVTGFTETADSISVQTAHGEFQAKWLVGCDGGRSTVRKAAEIGRASCRERV